MKSDRSELRQRIETLSDEELISMLTDNPEQYRSDVLSWAKEEAAGRNIELDFTAASNKVEEASVADRLLEAGKAGIGAAISGMQPGGYYAGGKKVICPHCQHDQFESQSSLVNTRGLTFFKLDWLNAAATTLSCSNCGLIQWFGIQPERSDEANGI
jgi:uncharacterized protein